MLVPVRLLQVQHLVVIVVFSVGFYFDSVVVCVSANAACAGVTAVSGVSAFPVWFLKREILRLRKVVVALYGRSGKGCGGVYGRSGEGCEGG